MWLQQAGYHTAQLGKYINGYGNDPGDNDGYGYGSDDPAVATEVPPGWTDWNGALNPGMYLETILNENGTLVSYEGRYQTDVYAEKAAEIVRSSAAGGQPFFNWISFSAPHDGDPREPDDPGQPGVPGAAGNGVTPVVADRHRDTFAADPIPDVPSFNEADVSDKPRNIRNRSLFSATTLAAIRERYQQRRESLLAVDEAIGRILSALDDTGQADNTLVVFTSDNGFFTGEHRVAQGKNLLYEPASRVPLILRGPGIPVGATRTQQVANIDLAPTFLQAAQATPGRHVNGRSLLQLAANPNVAQGRPILLEGAPRAAGALTAAVRTPRFQYTEVAATGEIELYDMRNDPYQLDSRHNDPAFADTRAELAQLLQTLRNT